MPKQPDAISDPKRDIDAMIGMAEYLIQEAKGVCPIAAAMLQLAKGELVATKLVLSGDVVPISAAQRRLS